MGRCEQTPTQENGNRYRLSHITSSSRGIWFLNVRDWNEGSLLFADGKKAFGINPVRIFFILRRELYTSLKSFVKLEIWLIE